MVAEARRTLTSLALYGYRVDAVVANRVFPADGGDAWLRGWVAAQARSWPRSRRRSRRCRSTARRTGPAEPVGLEELAAFAAAAYRDGSASRPTRSRCRRARTWCRCSGQVNSSCSVWRCRWPTGGKWTWCGRATSWCSRSGRPAHTRAAQRAAPLRGGGRRAAGRPSARAVRPRRVGLDAAMTDTGSGSSGSGGGSGGSGGSGRAGGAGATGAGGPGSLADEAGKLFEAVQEWLAERSGGAGERIATGSAECQLCPICRLIGLLRATNPEVVRASRRRQRLAARRVPGDHRVARKAVDGAPPCTRRRRRAHRHRRMRAGSALGSTG